MATPKSFASYPIEYTVLLRRASANPTRIPCTSNKEAIRFRNHLYAFRTAIRIETRTIIPEDLLLIAPLICFKIEGDTVILFKPKRVSNLRKALNAARGVQ